VVWHRRAPGKTEVAPIPDGHVNQDRNSSPRNVYRRPPSGGASDWVPRDPRDPRDPHRPGALRPGGAIARRRWPRRVLVAANVVVALTIVGAAGAYGYVQWRFNQIHRTHIAALSHTASHQAAFTLLVVGSDSRAALTGPGNAQYGGASAVGGSRSDTIILFRVVPATRQLMMMSIPRDLWVNIPGQGPNRINSAFNSGPNLLIETIKDDLGIAVNHYVEVNFDSFAAISNAVGGVKFYFPTPAKDTYSNLYVPKPGCYSLKGIYALQFVRARHYEYYANGSWQYEAESDLARIQRQQAFIRKLIKKAEGQFTNPIAVNDVIGGITKNLTVDSSFGISQMLDLTKVFRSINAGSIPSMTLPNYGYVTAGGADVLGLQQPQAAQTIAAFNAFGTQPAHPKPKSKTPTTTKPTLPPVTVAPSSINVEIANGTGTAGQAGEMSQTLAALGYHTSADQLSPGYGNATTSIHYAPDSLTAAEQLAAQIPGGGNLVRDASLTPSPFNIEVITGTTYSGGAAASARGGSSSTSPAVPTTTTTVPGANPSTYEVPGYAPGQTAPANCV
jgi:LCP family protein required for cell wall assembly